MDYSGADKIFQTKTKVIREVLKKEAKKMKNSIKHIKNFKKLRKALRNKLNKFQNDIEKTWTIMKKIVVKTKVKDTKITEKSLIAKNLNDFFVNVRPKLASVIPNSTKTFRTFLPEINTFLNGTELIEKEFLDAFQFVKSDKSPGFNKLHVNVIKFLYNGINVSLLHVMRNPIDNKSFTEKIKICQGYTNLQCW